MPHTRSPILELKYGNGIKSRISPAVANNMRKLMQKIPHGELRNDLLIKVENKDIDSMLQYRTCLG